MKKLFISGLVLFVICFSLACISWFTFEKQDNKTNKIHKRFNADNFDDLDVNTKLSNINVEQGKHFSVSYKGSKDIAVTQNKGHLKVKEKNNNEDHYGLNFNPFKKNESKINIKVPKKQQKQLSINLDSRMTNINNVNLNKVRIKTTYYNGLGLIVNNSHIENLKYHSKNSPVQLSNSEINKSDIKTGNNINIKKSLLKDAILLSKHSNIKLTHMESTSDIKASTSEGDILMSYATRPKDTLLKLNPVDGKAQVDNKYFKNGKVGNSDNVLEFYTDSGNIHIK